MKWELTCGQDGTIRQQLIEQLMREIMNYDAEFRRDAGTGANSALMHGTSKPSPGNGHGRQSAALSVNGWLPW